MDIETIRKHVADELTAEFEARLRDAKHQTSRAEEELENASERWKAERRRLNSEIDTLESALAEARIRKLSAPARKAAAPPAGEPRLGTEPDASAERLRTSLLEWSAEKTKLQAEITRLEHTIADLLERANNPLRTAHLATDRLQVQLNEAQESRKSLDSEFARARAQWEEERLKMAGELFRLRRWAGPSDQEHDESEALRRARAEIEQLEKKLAESQEHISADIVEQLRSQYAEKLQQIAQEKTRLASELENATTLLDRERQRFAASPNTDKPASAHEDVRAEASRVQAAIAEIERLIEDPAAELATVVRKNVERGELTAYLNGIFFALGDER